MVRMTVVDMVMERRWAKARPFNISQSCARQNALLPARIFCLAFPTSARAIKACRKVVWRFFAPRFFALHCKKLSRQRNSLHRKTQKPSACLLQQNLFA
jgi:hypothetical protein